MRKLLKAVGILALMGAVLYMSSVIRDKKQLSDEVLRLHVVANSDSAEDQAVKLKVRDAVLCALEDTTTAVQNKDEAEAVLNSKLAELESVANAVLDAEGFKDRAKVTLTEEEFPTRVYDTFTLPAGIYDSLRITIGSGKGHNWWCVVFPSLCVPAATEGVADTAASAGFSDSLSGAITEESGYEVRFFLLDCLGKLENLFHRG